MQVGQEGFLMGKEIEPIGNLMAFVKDNRTQNHKGGGKYEYGDKGAGNIDLYGSEPSAAIAEIRIARIDLRVSLGG